MCLCGKYLLVSRDRISPTLRPLPSALCPLPLFRPHRLNGLNLRRPLGRNKSGNQT